VPPVSQEVVAEPLDQTGLLDQRDVNQVDDDEDEEPDEQGQGRQ
jgi:hypothetical protein